MNWVFDRLFWCLLDGRSGELDVGRRDGKVVVLHLHIVDTGILVRVNPEAAHAEIEKVKAHVGRKTLQPFDGLRFVFRRGRVTGLDINGHEKF